MWKDTSFKKGTIEWSLSGVLGRQDSSSNAHTVELHHNYNGSGPHAFGGAEQWPVVTTKVAFEESEEELAICFAAEQRLFVEQFFEKRGGHANEAFTRGTRTCNIPIPSNEEALRT